MIQKKKEFIYLLFIIISLIFIIGFFLRAQETLSGNYLFLLDSGRDMMDVKKIVFEHKLTLIGPYTSLGGVFQGPLYYYLLAIPTFIFNGDPWGNILLMLLLSLLTMTVAFLFMRKYFGIVPAVITLAFFAVSPEAIAAATYFWNPHPMWLIITTFIFVLYGAVTKNKKMMIMLFPLIAIGFHFEMAFGVFLSLATVIYILLFQRFLLREKTFWIGVLFSSIFFVPQVVFDVRHNFLMSRSVLAIVKGSNQGLVANGDHVGFLATVSNNFTTFSNNFNSGFISYYPFTNFPTFVLLIGVGILLYLYYKKMFLKEEKRFLHVVLSFVGIIFIFSIFYPFPLRYWFLTGFQSFYLVLAGFLFGKIYTYKYGKPLIAIIFCIFLTTSFFRLNVLYGKGSNDIGLAKIKGKEAAIDYIYQDAGNKKFNVLVFNPPVVTDAYDYLFWWYGKKKYGFIPPNKKEGLTYLLMEPDPWKPWSYKGWLETVIKTGKVLETKNLPSGLIVQKRDFSVSK